jgi:flagellum-specific peptidoglycan hydrolase FlgJ
MRALIDPVIASYQLRPEFEAALGPPEPAACPRCRHEAAAQFKIEGGNGDHSAGIPAGPSTACPHKMRRTIGRFARHQNAVGSLPPREQTKLMQIARAIVRSHRPDCSPIGSVLMIGHADHDPVREEQQPGFIARISGHRALAVQKALIHLVGDPALSSKIRWIHRGVGDRFPAVQDPQTEEDRARNRRVDVIFNPRSHVPPQPGPQPKPPQPRPAPNQPQPKPQPQPTPAAKSFPPVVVAAAIASHHRWRVPASVTLAQWAVESAYGTKMPRGSNNPFGIKAGKGQPFVEAQTREVIGGKSVTVVAKFRKFDSMAQAFDEHGRLLATSRYYTRAMSLAANPDSFADALTGVYATDPRYGSVLKSVMRKDNLYQYDKV